MKQFGKSSHERGFSLMELLISVSIMVILATIGIPSFVSYTATQDSKRGAQTLYASLLTARAEALKRNANVYVHANGGNSSDWGNGWIITTNVALDTVDCQSTSALPGVLFTHCRDGRDGLEFSSPVSSITYRPDGRATPARVQLCHDSANVRSVRVEAGGLPYLSTSGDCT